MSGLMQKIRTKRTLYILCFMAFSLIEFFRSTGTGNVWSAAANCTGIVMMVIVFSVLPLKEFLRPAYYVYSGICIAALPIIYIYWTRHKGEFYFGQTETAVLNIWLIGLALHYFWRQYFEKKQIKLKLGITAVLWIALTVWTVISVANSWWPIWFLLLFGVFYLVRFSEKDRTALIDGMIDGTVISFFIIQSWAYLFRPYDAVRYRGAFANCNMMALYYLIVYCMVLFKLHLLYVKKAKWGWKLFYFIGAGGLLGFQFMTMCRTAWVSAVIVTVCYGVIVFRGYREEKWGKILLRGCTLALCMAIVFPAVFLTVRWIPTIHPHPIWHDGEWSKKKVHSWDPADSPKYIDWGEFWEEVLGRFYKSAEKYNSRNPLVLKAHAQEDYQVYMDDYSWTRNTFTQRLTYFKVYLQHSKWFGNPLDKGVSFPEIKRHPWHSQNLWVQFTYTYGYPAGLLLVLLTIAVLAKNWRRAMRSKDDPYAMIPFLICVVYFTFGVSEAVWFPGQLILTLMFFVQHPQMAAERENGHGFVDRVS